MGVSFFFSRSSCDDDKSCSKAAPPPRLPNPDPSNFKVLKHKQIGNALVVEVQYPGCTNYEGIKVMVYLNTTLKELTASGRLDPHFCPHLEHSPIARFAPTEIGWKLALRLCTWLTKF